MKWIVRSHKKAEAMQVYRADSGFASTSEPGPNKNRLRLLAWLVGAIFIFALLYCSSYLALLWLPADEGMDMKSQLAVDYRPWSVLVFQPVDAAIIDEIQQEQGLPEQIVTNGSFWPTPASTLTVPTLATDTTASTPQAAPDTLPSSSTAFPPLATSTAVPASTILPTISNVTSQPTGAVNPTQPPKPKKTKTPKPPKPPKNK
jgi:hypothetical protein